MRLLPIRSLWSVGIVQWLFGAYIVAGLTSVCVVAISMESPGEWLWAFIGGLIAWGAVRNGVYVGVKGQLLFSLELGAYLFVFLVVGVTSAFVSVFLCSMLLAIFGITKPSSDRKLEKSVKRLVNICIIGGALFCGATAYSVAGGSQPLVALDGRTVGALLLFWLVFTVINLVLAWPLIVDWEKNGKEPMSGIIIKDLIMDGGLHALGVLSGAGFALLYNLLGVGPLLLLLPVYVMLVVILKRVSEQENRLGIQQNLLHRINEWGIRLHRSLDLNEVLEEVGSAEAELFGGDAYLVALVDERSGRLQYARAVDRCRQYPIEDVDLRRGLAGWVLRSGEFIFSGDIRKEDTFREFIDLTGNGTEQIRSVMAGPLRDKERAIGVFSVQSSTEHAFQSFHRELFLSILQQISTAVVAARLYRRATQDSLTRLNNRSYLEERLRLCLKEKIPFGLIFIDCDQFKPINDRYGHAVGDRYLAALARQIHQSCRSGDVSCRFGGDEFAVLLPGIEDIHTRKVADRIMAAVDDLTVPVEGDTVTTTVSIGVLWSGGVREDVPVEDIFQAVDRAMYEAKQIRHTIVETSM